MEMNPLDIGMLTFIGGMIFLSLVGIVGGLLHLRRVRMMAHAERMKALELGRELPEEPAVVEAKAKAVTSEEKGYAGKCYSMTGHACFWGFLFAIGAASKEGGNAPGAAYAIAAAAGAVGVTGLICGTVLASKSLAEDRAPVKQRYDHDGI